MSNTPEKRKAIHLGRHGTLICTRKEFVGSAIRRHCTALLVPHTLLSNEMKDKIKREAEELWDSVSD